jgi:TRAP-type C4-dicarboxylate transport system permease small subunit
MELLKKIDRRIIEAERRLSELLLAFIIVFVFIAAFLRVVRKPLVWSVDMAQLLFIWVCFIGADLAMLKDKHIGVDLLTNLMPQRVRGGIKLFSGVLAIVFLGLIAAYGARLAIINVNDQFSGMELSHSWATWSAPVGCILMIRTQIKKLYGLRSGIGSGAGSREETP